MLVSHRTYSKTEYRKAACYIRRYLIHPTSHRAPLVCWVDCVGLVTKGLVWRSIARYKIVMQRSSLVYHGISHMSLVVPSYWENTSDSWDFPWYATPCHSDSNILSIKRYQYLRALAARKLEWEQKSTSPCFVEFLLSHQEKLFVWKCLLPRLYSKALYD